VIDPKIGTRSKPTQSEQSESLVNAAVALADSVVQTRAYELYERRRRTNGHAEQDWYQAENDIRARRKQGK
jgi:hypothetical protein